MSEAPAVVVSGEVIPEIPPPPDENAVDEAQAIASQNLRRKHADAREIHLHRGGLCLFWAALVAVILTGAVWLFHMLAPDAYLFLPEPRRADLQNVLISALGSSFVTQIARRWIQRDDE